MFKNQNKLVKILLIALMVLAISFVLAWINPLQKIQFQLSNFLYYEHPSQNPIVIVGIDQRSQTGENGLGDFKDWSRSYHAQVIENLEKYQPAVIGIDLHFRDRTQGLKQTDLDNIFSSSDPLLELQKYSPQQINPNDQILSDVLHQYKNIVLAFPPFTVAPSYSEINSQNTVIAKPYNLFADLPVGFNRVFPDVDGVIHDYPLEMALSNQSQLSFVSQILQKILKYSTNIPQESGQLKINFNQLPPLNLDQGVDQPNVKNVSYLDVFNDQYPKGFDPNYFKGKIVLIGAFYETSSDNYFTALNAKTPTPMPGVMIHAQALQTILDQDWLRNVSLPEQAASIFLLTLLTILISLKLPIRFAAPSLLIMILIYNLFLTPLFFRNFGVILNLVYPNIAIILAMISAYAFRYFSEFRQKRSLQTNLTKFVDQSIVQKSLEENANLTTATEKKDITVMFTDIANFTSISESLQPNSVVELLNEYLEIMTAIIVKHGGTIDKFEGDAIMALFGAPQSQDDHALRAATAALEMRKALPALNAKWKNDPPLSGGETKPQIDFRVGLSSGVAVVGSIGSENRLSFTAIGDIVNLGSRLESANKQYSTHILISEKTFNQINNTFICRFVDFIRVKGKNQAIKIFELLGPTESITTEEKEILQIYTEALEYYFQKDFNKASEIFQNQLLSKYPNDKLAAIYAGRCELLKHYPPQSNWDFVYEMKNK